MESCYAVEKELEKLLSKFSYIDKHTANSLQELLTYVDGVKRELIEGQLFSEPNLRRYVVGRRYNADVQMCGCYNG